MQLFEVLKSVETKELHGDSLISLIDPRKGYLLTDDSNHTIYTYVGKNANWIYSLLTEHLAKEIRSHMAVVYQIETVTEEIWNTLKNLNLDSQGAVPPIINPDLYSIEELTTLIQEKKAIQLRIDTAWRSHLQEEDIIVFRKSKPSETLELLQHHENPYLYEREMILINTSLYTKQKSLLSFLPNRSMEEQITKIGNIPDGAFFFQDYTPRLFIRKGRVNAVELFRKKTEKSEKSVPNQQLGTIDFPVLPFPRIQKENDSNLLIKAFHRPPKESLEEFLAREE